MVGQLSSTLDALWASGLPIVEKRRAAARLLAAAVGLVAPSQSDAEPPFAALTSFEECLTSVAEVAGCSRDVRSAKAWLRLQSHGGPRLASVLGKLSKMRNHAAHPFAAVFLSELSALRRTAGPCDRALADDSDTVGAEAATDSSGDSVPERTLCCRPRLLWAPAALCKPNSTLSSRRRRRSSRSWTPWTTSRRRLRAGG